MEKATNKTENDLYRKERIKYLKERLERANLKSMAKDRQIRVLKEKIEKIQKLVTEKQEERKNETTNRDRKANQMGGRN